ncbi:MAG TPA: hypothetical protein QGH10_13325, partial [Armatimonadota bacterium]|nr:hypothetical protein [Armatimonadota bacterium]
MRRITWIMVALAASWVAARPQLGHAASAGLFPLVGMQADLWPDHVDGAAYPTVDPAFVGGVSDAFSAIYVAQIAGAGCNSLTVEVPVPFDVETTANRLANLCTWAHSQPDGGPMILVALTDLHEPTTDATTPANVASLVAATAQKLRLADETLAQARYESIAGFQVAPGLNVVQARSGAGPATTVFLTQDLRSNIHAAEAGAFGDDFANTPIYAGFSMDYALLTRGSFSGAELAAADLDAAYAEMRTYFDALRVGPSADILTLDWFPGTYAGGTSDDVVTVFGRLAMDYPDDNFLLARTGGSTAFNTAQSQADYCLGLMAGLAAGSGGMPGFLGLSWTRDLDRLPPEAPDAAVGERIGAWSPEQASTKIAEAYRGDSEDVDALWWLGRTDSGLGLASVDDYGAIDDKTASLALRSLVDGGAVVADAGAGPGAADATPNLAVTELALEEGSLAEGEEIVLRATLHNSSPGELPAVLIDFTYLLDGEEEMRWIGEAPISISVPADTPTNVSSPRWVLPADVVDVGIVAWSDDLVEAEEENNSLVASLTELGEGAVGAPLDEAAPVEVVATDADLSVAGISVGGGTLAEGETAYLRADVENAGAGDALGADVYFIYALDGVEEWQYIGEMPQTL